MSSIKHSHIFFLFNLTFLPAFLDFFDSGPPLMLALSNFNKTALHLVRMRRPAAESSDNSAPSSGTRSVIYQALNNILKLSRFNKNLLKLKKNTIFQNIFIELKSSKHLINPCHLFVRITLPVLSISRCWHWMGWQKPSSFESNELWGKHGKCPRPATQTIINPRPARTLCKIDNRINFYRISYLLTPVAGYK